MLKYKLLSALVLVGSLTACATNTISSMESGNLSHAPTTEKKNTPALKQAPVAIPRAPTYRTPGYTPNTHYVRSYFRKNGTFVHGHRAGNPRSGVHCHNNICY